MAAGHFVDNKYRGSLERFGGVSQRSQREWVVFVDGAGGIYSDDIYIRLDIAVLETHHP